MNLNLNWQKIYNTKHKNVKNAKNQTCVFVQNRKKKEMEIFAFFVMNFKPIII